MVGTNASPDPQDRAGFESHASVEELAAYALDPDALPADRRAHIRACSVCAPEAAWLGNAVVDLNREARCPSVDVLTGFALGESSSEEQIWIAAHVRDCAACAETLALTRATFQAPAQPAGVVSAIHRIVAMLAPPEVGLRHAQDAGAPTQGASGAVFEAGDVRVSLRIEPEGDASIISGTLRISNAPIQLAEVESVALLYAAADDSPALVAQAPVTESNDFDLLAVPRGTYRLELVRGNTLVVLSPIIVP